MTEQFANPAAPGESVDWQGLSGSLLLIEPTELVQGINTVHGVSNAVRANVTVIDGPQAGQRNEDALIFPKVLQSQVRGKIGQKVLGRLGQGVAKPGMSAPWMLHPATPDDIARANASVGSGQHQQRPATGTPGQGWGQQPPQQGSVSQPGPTSAQPPF